MGLAVCGGLEPGLLPQSVLRFTGIADGRRNRVMKSRRFFAIALALVLASGSAPTLLAQGQYSRAATIAGTAKDEAKKPYEEYTVQARDGQGAVGATTKLNSEGNFVLPNLMAARYHVELLNKDGKLICTEGPFDITPQTLKNDVVINCGKKLVPIILLTGAGVAGITAGILAAKGPTSPSQ
jgi:hypothetical protein